MIELPSSDAIQYWSGVATIFGLPIAILAFFYAARQLSLAQKAGSGASLIALSEAFRQNWSAFVAATSDAQKRHAFADLANALEIACAVFRDGVFFGHSKNLLKHYLVHQFRVIQDSELAGQRLVSLLQTKETFNEIRWFVETHRALINSTALGEKV
ncbi:hypothetical protein [Bradyrhizobium sp. OK095]|uniref:hypothetical protein n=1 Tax=Bradyrhizobium sp. OK095 TaxID=1882760 RepID=UPI000B862962|nr:hypothetical protein [Bradyrhizobium sp. OK095]